VLEQWLQLPSSSVNVPLTRSGSTNGPWDSGATLTASDVVPTNSNFGYTTSSPFRRRFPWRLALAGCGVLVAGVAVALFVSTPSDAPAVASAASSAVPEPPRALAAPPPPVVVTTSEPPPRDTPDDETNAPLVRVPRGGDAEEEPLTRPRVDVQRRTPRQQRSGSPAAARATAATTATVAPATPATSAKRRRDFGY
jgi:hypothetical protein